MPASLSHQEEHCCALGSETAERVQTDLPCQQTLDVGPERASMARPMHAYLMAGFYDMNDITSLPGCSFLSWQNYVYVTLKYNSDYVQWHVESGHIFFV